MLEKDIKMDVVLAAAHFSDPHRAKGSISVYIYPCSFGGNMDLGCSKIMNIDMVLSSSWDPDVST